MIGFFLDIYSNTLLFARLFLPIINREHKPQLEVGLRSGLTMSRLAQLSGSVEFSLLIDLLVSWLGPIKR